MHLAPKNVEGVTLVSCVLHNFLRKKLPVCYNSPGMFDKEDADTGMVIEGNWRLEMNENNRVTAIKSSHQRCSVKKDVLRNFAKFTGKHLCQSLHLQLY